MASVSGKLCRVATSLLTPTERPIISQKFASAFNFRSQSDVEDAKKSLVIFDKDGTLICFHSMWVPWTLHTAQRLENVSNLPVSEKVYRLLGFCPVEQKVRPGLLAEGTMQQIRDQIQTLLISHGLTETQARSVVSVSVEDCQTDQGMLREIHDLKELFSLLRHHDVKVAICTADSRSGTMGALTKLGLVDLVDAVVCGDDRGARPKPDPHNALAICRALKVLPQEALMVGDTLADMGMGRSARLGGTVAVLSGVGRTHELSPHADHVVPHVGELMPIVLGQRT